MKRPNFNHKVQVHVSIDILWEDPVREDVEKKYRSLLEREFQGMAIEIGMKLEDLHNEATADHIAKMEQLFQENYP